MSDDNVIHFTRLPLNDVPASLIALAGRAQRGETTMVRAVLIWETEGQTVDYSCLGIEPFTRPHALGMCTIAQDLMIRDCDPK